MRKLFATLLALTMVSSCVLPCYAASFSTESEDDWIYLEYEEFHGNRAYYDVLLLQGYTICVYVGDEYADEEINRIVNSTGTLHTLIPFNYARGTALPTAEIDIHDDGPYNFTCDADYETLYTNVKIYGCTNYQMSGFNEDYNNNLRIRLYSTTKGTVDFSVPPRSSIYKIFATASSSTRFFAAFYPPSNAYGSIRCIGH